MTTIREVYRAFSDFAERQRKTIQSIKDEIREGRAQIADTKKELKDRIAYLFSDYETFPDEILTEASRAAGSERNFTLLLKGMERENEGLSQMRAKLITEYGTPERLLKERTALNADILEIVTKTNEDNVRLKELSDRQEPFNRHVRKVKYALSGELDDDQIKNAVTYYTTPSIARCFSPDWLVGNNLVRKYESGGDSLVADWATRTQLRESVGAGMVDSSVKERRVVAITAATEKMEQLQRQIKPEAQICAVLQDRLFEAMFDEKFIDEMTARLGEDITKPLAESVLKIVNLTKIEHNLEGVLETAEKTYEKLNAPLGKLRRGSSNAGYRSIDIDLPQVEKAVAGQEQYVQRLSANTQQMRSSIRGYSHESSSGRSYETSRGDDLTMFNMMNMWMIMSIMDNTNTDNALVGHTLGEIKTSDISGLDTNISGADFNADTGGLHDIANQSFNVPDIQPVEVSIPDISVSVPDFSVPDFSSTTIDTGGSVTFDSGSNF